MQGRQEKFLHSIRMRYRDLVWGRPHKLSVSVMKLLDSLILVAIENDFEHPQASDGCPKGARDIFEGREKATPC